MRLLLIALLIAILSSCLFLPVPLGLGESNPNVLRVPIDYPRIQTAINAADAGDVILIAPGAYYETLTINKNDLTLTGEDRQLTIINGEQSGPIISIRATNVLINNITMKLGHDGIFLIHSQNCRLIDNNLVDIYYYAVLLSNSHNNQILNNTITRDRISCWAGIRLESSTGNLIQNNNITEINETYGVGLFSSENNTIQDNNIARNNEGIYMFHSSYNIFERNNITANKWSAIRLENSNNNSIQSNYLSQNWPGLRFTDSFQNKICHNNFVDNIVQVDFLGESVNIWDDGYPSGGNYWSDHNWTDLFSGPYQNLTGSDGIGDEPYMLNPQDVDSFPLNGVLLHANVGEWNNTTYFIDTICNYTVSSLMLHPNDRFVQFEIDTINNSLGFCRTMIPKPIMYSSTTEWKVLINAEPTNYTVTEDETSTYLFFPVTHPANTVKIIGAKTIVLPKIHEITLSKIVANATRLYFGDKLKVIVTVHNLGETSETFNVSAYLNNTQIATFDVVNVAQNENISQTFVLDSGNMSLYVDYEAKFQAGPVSDERNITDNIFVLNKIIVKIAGDLNGDAIVDILDIAIVAQVFGTTPNDPNWNPIADINNDALIDILDISKVATEFNKTYP